jgi:hypothetical protein
LQETRRHLDTLEAQFNDEYDAYQSQWRDAHKEKDARVDQLIALAEEKAATAEKKLCAKNQQSGAVTTPATAEARSAATNVTSTTDAVSSAFVAPCGTVAQTSAATTAVVAPPEKPKWLLQKEHSVVFDQTKHPELQDLELDDKAKMVLSLWQLLQRARLQGSAYAYTYAMFGLAHSDVEYIIGKEISTQVLGTKPIVPDDVISDQLMDLFSFQLARGLESVATQQEERTAARKAAELALAPEHMSKLRRRDLPY